MHQASPSTDKLQFQVVSLFTVKYFDTRDSYSILIVRIVFACLLCDLCGYLMIFELSHAGHAGQSCQAQTFRAGLGAVATTSLTCGDLLAEEAPLLPGGVGKSGTLRKKDMTGSTVAETS